VSSESHAMGSQIKNTSDSFRGIFDSSESPVEIVESRKKRQLLRWGREHLGFFDPPAGGEEKDLVIRDRLPVGSQRRFFCSF
jgi:hypothetical protein